MSEQNLELVREIYEFSQRQHEPDYDRLDPDVQWHTRADLPDTTTYRGHAGAKTLIDEWSGAFDDLSVDIEEMIDAGDRWLR
jgi:ketosteroid isomerase-like protein